jgi:hypothetical protein
MSIKSKFYPIAVSTIIILSLCLAVIADTIRLKDGSVIKGKVIGFRDGQFIVLVGDSTKGRQRQVSYYSDEIESIEFDVTDSPRIDNPTTNRNTVSTTTEPRNTNTNTRQTDDDPIIVGKTNTNSNSSNTNTKSNTNTSISQVINSQPTNTITKTSSNIRFVKLNLKVLADNTANGWTNANYVVKKGQRIRITGIGRVSLGNGRFSTPAGVGSLTDSDKLMQTEPTGALIAVIGDDNNDFIFIGASREFIAQRDGTLFLGVNEGNLDDNSGAYDVTIEAEDLSNK